MTKKTAIISYIFLLILSVIGIVVVMPKQVTVPLAQYKLLGGKNIVVSRPDLKITFLGMTFTRDLEMKEGLDIKGGTQVILSANMKDIAQSERDSALQTAQEVISRRINLYGVSESSVQTSRSGGDYRLIVEIPGVQNSDDAVKLIGSTAQLEFREYAPANNAAKTASLSAMLIADFKPAGLSGKELSKATVQFDPNSGKPTIGLEFTNEGAAKFGAITKRNIGKPLAVFLDDYPITTPVVQTEIDNGRAQISGDFTVDSAKQLSIALNAGALPVPIQVIGQTTVGASLGNDAVMHAVEAGVIGVVILMFFMILLYGFKGFLSCISLLLYGLVTLALYKLIPVTLSLAGIAGFLLSMGMAVDTNVLVFERLKEEERRDSVRSVQVKLDRAFARAWNSIKDANATTLITCFVLYNPLEWGFLNRSGMVRGFALTLAMGIAINIFCGMFVTRVLMTLFYGEQKQK